jgi:hypothetical protein
LRYELLVTGASSTIFLGCAPNGRATPRKLDGHLIQPERLVHEEIVEYTVPFQLLPNTALSLMLSMYSSRQLDLGCELLRRQTSILPTSHTLGPDLARRSLDLDAPPTRMHGT